MSAPELPDLCHRDSIICVTSTKEDFMKRLYLSLLSILVLAGCASSRSESEIANGVAGDTVQSICFTRNINSWQPYSSDSLIVRRGLNDYFRLVLAGSCELDRAFNAVAIQSRDGICLSVGDRVNIPEDFGGSCTITHIENWIIPAD